MYDKLFEVNNMTKEDREYARLKKTIIKKIRALFAKTKAKGVVLGISGGLDSTVTAYLLVEALGRKKVVALIMPEKNVTSTENIKDAKNIAKKLGIKYYTIYINRLTKLFSNLPWKQTKIAKANLKARLRMVILYNFANSNNCLVAGTSNKSELLLGYFTKYGDGASDFLPIGRLLKTEVKKMAEMMQIPERIIRKKPTAELWKGQTDEKELGFSYEEIDKAIIKINSNKKLSLKEKKIRDIIEKNRHKRLPILI
ncbi:MAG: NAD+ synthase [Candidatus Diapherotrites archaeon]|nr:NAD+ synthase [Candidatus Diapherotrites archaeon]